MQDSGTRGGQMLNGLTDYHDHLSFVIKRVGHFRAYDRLIMRHERGSASHEKSRKFWDIVALQALFDVLKIIQAETNDLAEAAHRKSESKRIDRLVRACGSTPSKID